MIKFPKVHIAESVVNRILDIADGMPDTGGSAAPELRQPAIPDATAQGIELDLALTESSTDGLPGLDQAPDPGATVQGKPLLATMLDPQE